MPLLQYVHPFARTQLAIQPRGCLQEPDQLERPQAEQLIHIAKGGRIETSTLWNRRECGPAPIHIHLMPGEGFVCTVQAGGSYSVAGQERLLKSQPPSTYRRLSGTHRRPASEPPKPTPPTPSKYVSQAPSTTSGTFANHQPYRSPHLTPTTLQQSPQEPSLCRSR